MAREVSDWLDGYLKYTEGSEPPRSYHCWVGLSLIAGALQRRVYLEWGFETIYPNLYIVLVGASGKTRKGVALGIGKDLLSDVAGVTVVAESTTRQALIRKMKDASATYTVPMSGKIAYHCSVTVVSEELSVFLGQKDIAFLANLTDWYDSKDRWTYETVGRGTDFIQGVCCNFIGGTAPDWLQSMLPQEAIGGGFTARILFIVEDAKGKTVSKHVLSPEDIRLRQALVNDLQRINNLAGPFRFTKDGERVYTGWYEKYSKELEGGKYPVADPKFSAYCERRQTHLRKVAMLVSASHSDTLSISAADVERALDIITKAELKMHKTFGGLGKSKIATETYAILEYIQKLKLVSKADLLAKFHADLTIQDFKMVEDLMEQMKVVEITILKGGDKVYKWKGYKKDQLDQSPAEAKTLSQFDSGKLRVAK
jgi:hypothetical protein